jgi:hypothetical protein
VIREEKNRYINISSSDNETLNKKLKKINRKNKKLINTPPPGRN